MCPRASVLNTRIASEHAGNHQGPKPSKVRIWNFFYFSSFSSTWWLLRSFFFQKSPDMKEVEFSSPSRKKKRGSLFTSFYQTRFVVTSCARLAAQITTLAAHGEARAERHRRRARASRDACSLCYPLHRGPPPSRRAHVGPSLVAL